MQKNQKRIYIEANQPSDYALKDFQKKLFKLLKSSMGTKQLDFGSITKKKQYNT